MAVASVAAAAAALGVAAPAVANESHDHSSDSGSGSGSGGGTTVNTRTASATIAPSDGFVTVYAKCEANEVPVNGYWLVDGEEPEGNPKVYYSLNGTGERSDGYRVSAGTGDFFPGNPVGSEPVEVTAYARCLVVDN